MVFASRDKYVTGRLGGLYGEKHWPRSWKCCLMPQWIEINLGWLIVWKCEKGERLLFTANSFTKYDRSTRWIPAAVAVRMRKFHPLQEPIGSTKFNFFSARERNSANPVIWLVPGAGGIFSYGPPQQAESFVLIYFRERQSFTLFTLRRRLPPFSLIRDFGKQNTRGNVSKISVSLACYWQIESKSTNCSH